MSVQLNHTIVWCRHAPTSANFLTELLGLAAAVPFGPFLVAELANGVSLDYHEIDGPIASQHYAFLLTEGEFDRTFDRIADRGIDCWADPGKQQRSRINRADGGRGVYFCDPDDHLLEIITRPYGSD